MSLRSAEVRLRGQRVGTLEELRDRRDDAVATAMASELPDASKALLAELLQQRFDTL